MELKELEHFVAVVHYGSFSKAASHIYISQPTLSKSVMKLEETLQVILFERSTRRLYLTDAGKLVYEQANKIINQTKELTTSLDDLRNTPIGEIKIGIPPLIGTLFFPIIAKNFTNLHPNISLRLIEHGAKKIEYLIESGEIDLGIVVLPVQEKKFTILPFVHEEFMFFCHRNHPLANQEAIDISILNKEKFILFNQEFALHRLIIEYCKTVGTFYPDIAFETSQWDVIAELVSVELGITLLPKSTYNKMDKTSIVAIPLHSPPKWQLGVITKKDRYITFAVRALLNYLEESRPLNKS